MHITFTKNMHECFLFIYFYLVKFSCQNTIFIYFLKKNCQWELWDKNGKKCRKVKKREKYRGLGRYMTIFSLFFPPPIFPLLLLLHFSTARLRLGHDWKWCRVEKYQKRGLERKIGPKRHRFGLYFFFFKGTGSKRFGLFLLKLKRAKTMLFWPYYFKRTATKTMSFWTLLF